ncbi:hypothetical protein CLIB1444_02S08966 [[Candida] jaroonii]|uniref:Uncharacterized protein n=1 Tax=[Candida] jaroonii TaxID=467808 RepID=A0ACA9Y3C7_9ASCO|nr:hypothetical protein CLIB1444_02S08966 [[Candida] jaroonii]
MDSLNKVKNVEYPDGSGTEVQFHKIEVADTIILNILIDGIVDTTFELPLNSQQSINILSDISNLDEESLGIEPIILIGDYKNLKIQIVASQIGKLFLKKLKSPKNVILSIGSKWFGKGDESTDRDFDKLMFILENTLDVI